jgi:hypothetical protein
MTQNDLADLVRRFEACTLPREEWTHQAHLCVALWYLRRFPRAEATLRIRAGIQRYNASLGNTKGYHETITLSWIALLWEFLQTADPLRSLSDLVDEVTARYNRSDDLLRYYSREVLFSDRAKAEYVSPDLRPLEGCGEN